MLLLKLFHMSVAASWLVLAVALLRLILRKAPRRLTVLLWALVAVRLICPYSIESSFSLIPTAETLPDSIAVGSVSDPAGDIASIFIGDHLSDSVAASNGSGFDVISAASAVWILGIAVIALYTAFSCRRIRKKVRESIPAGEGVYVCDSIDTPFIFGMLRPRIYIPSSMDKADAEHVLAHERAHLRRLDHIWKPLGFLLLTVYWFCPVMWLAYSLFCRDIEFACDEKVISGLGEDAKKPYSTSLINCSEFRMSLPVCPLAFGEVGVRARVKSILRYKKPSLLIVVISVILCAAVAVCFLTDPESAADDVKLCTPPVLNIVCEDTSVRALLPHYEWIVKEEDGIRESIACGSSPSHYFTDEMKPFREGAIPLPAASGGTRTAKLQFAGTPPDKITVNCQEKISDDLFSCVIEVVGIGESLSLPLKDRGYVYEVVAEWNSSPLYSGTAYYCFYAEG